VQLLLLSLRRSPRNQITSPTTKGDADGLGAVREKELLASCAALGVPARGVTVLNRSDLRDGMRTEWPLGSVAAAVEGEVKRRRPRAVATFDAYGVSGHANHRAVHAGVRCVLLGRGVVCQQSLLCICFFNDPQTPSLSLSLESRSMLLEQRGRALGIERAWQLVRGEKGRGGVPSFFVVPCLFL
jgi:LmbE family N-acetylglucosaminyl deacetylase